MTETLDSTAGAAETPEGSAAKAPRKRAGGLNSMLLADLKAMAGGMGIPGAGSMKKAALVDAIKAAQAGGGAPARAEKADQPAKAEKKAEQPRGEQPKAEQPKAEQPKAEQPKAEQPKAEQPKAEQPKADRPKAEQPKADEKKAEPRADEPKAEQPQQGRPRQRNQGNQGNQGNQQGNQGQQKQGGQGNQNQQGNQSQQKAQPKQDEPRPADDDGHDDGDGDGEGGSRRNRRRRGRDRDRTTRAGREPDTEVREDDVLVPAAGILDVLDNYAFVRTSGYLAGVDDVYLSLSMVRKYGLRRGDAVVGQVRQPREGERREKFNPMVRIDTVNGVDPEQAKNRVEFDTLTPVSPTDRLRLETGPDALVGRVIDLVTPVGKGQRGLVLAPSDAGKTATVQAIANAITANNPECHLMVVLIDERPEEVTDFQRAVKGEVVASTFDRPATDHTTLAELAIERAKRLVELGHDVVVLLDGLTRLGRAYNLTAPASGRVLPGGVDAAALYPPKKLFGAARNIDNGGSLTILATALVDGSKMDEAVLEELTGTDNLRLHLSRELADRGLVPAVDVHASGTRREDQLLTTEELAVLGSLRAELAGKDAAAALEQLLGMVRNSHTNYELLVRLQRG